MMSPGLLAALTHAENWVDHEDSSHHVDKPVERPTRQTETAPIAQQRQAEQELTTKTERELIAALSLS
jgi:hypothetical protein